MQSELDQEGQTECKWLRKGQEGILNKPGMEMGTSHTGHDGRFSSPFSLELENSCGRVVGHKNEQTDHGQMAESFIQHS